MQWDEEGGHVLHDKRKAYTNPRGQAGSMGPPVARLWRGRWEWDAGMLQAPARGTERESRWGPAVSQPGQGLISKQKNMFFVSQRWQRHHSLTAGGMLCDTKIHWGRDGGVSKVGGGLVTPPVLTVDAWRDYLEQRPDRVKGIKLVFIERPSQRTPWAVQESRRNSTWDGWLT